MEDTEPAKVSQELAARFYNMSAVGEGRQCPNRVFNRVTSSTWDKHSSAPMTGPLRY